MTTDRVRAERTEVLEVTSYPFGYVSVHLRPNTEMERHYADVFRLSNDEARALAWILLRMTKDD